MLQKQRYDLVLWLVLEKRLEECDFQRGLNMERKIGEIFLFDGKLFEVVDGVCYDCHFYNNDSCCNEELGECSCGYREDNRDVCFKLVKGLWEH